ncbi:MAG: metal ABC transporter ATP-binding protein [Geminicoccaceae bacterium]|nr:MAG: metal ABC transporter ATP-binding protein [Geminicoccaceae bacterium]
MHDTTATTSKIHPPGPLVVVRAASVRFGGLQALEAVDLTIGAGEIITLIGPNGAGKSTLVRLVLGVLKPNTGTVERRAGLSVAYVPQRLAIDATLPLTVDRFLDLPVRRTRAKKTAALAEAGVTGVERQPLQTLSGGQFQRVLLARALLAEPDLLVLDEPAQNIDHLGQIELYELIAGLRRRRGCAVLLVSHDLHLVMRATDRVICLQQRIRCAGAPEAVGKDPIYAELFGKRAAEALAFYPHHHDHEGERVVPLDRARER